MPAPKDVPRDLMLEAVRCMATSLPQGGKRPFPVVHVASFSGNLESNTWMLFLISCVSCLISCISCLITCVSCLITCVSCLSALWSCLSWSMSLLISWNPVFSADDSESCLATCSASSSFVKGLFWASPSASSSFVNGLLRANSLVNSSIICAFSLRTKVRRLHSDPPDSPTGVKTHTYCALYGSARTIDLWASPPLLATSGNLADWSPSSLTVARVELVALMGGSLSLVVEGGTFAKWTLS
mmetsp:Transcript_120181/g.335308  ORF Transcript_120181/g.335308 Transcript_120181/m.335308 type:complete len:242 (+) Transcript_120181:51-776(+)